MKKFLIILLTLSLTFVMASDKRKTSDEIDHIALAALLLKDGHIDRAREELNQVNLETKDLDLIKYYTLKGLVASKQGLYAESNKFFNMAIVSGQQEKSVYLYIAQNSFKLKEYKQTIDAIESAGALADKKASIHALKAECFWRLKEYDSALKTLKIAIGKFNKEYSFHKQRFNYYVTLKLYQSALEDATVYLNNAKASEKTSLSFISALRKSGETDKAIRLAEKVNLQYPESASVTVLLAHLYIDKGMIQVAADLFDEASIEDVKYTTEAAEMMRRASEFVTALYKNSQILDAKAKLRQRIAIYIQYGDYERIVVSHKALKRSKLIEDENIRYALAYAYYKVGEFEESEKQLKELTSAELFQKATQIRNNMQKCINNHWECEL